MIAILSSTWDEIKEIKKELSKTEEGEWDVREPQSNEELEFVRGKFREKPVLLGQTGVGIRRARKGASLIIQKFKPELIISAGSAGALSPELKVGDIVIGEWALSLRKNEKRKLLSELPDLGGGFKKGGILTENRFIHEPGEKKKLFETSGALAVDMETWGVVEAALQSGVPVLSVRSISDEPWETLPNIGSIFNSRGIVDKKKTLAYFMSHPSHILPFLKFRFFSAKKSSRSLNRFLRKIILMTT